MGFRWVRVFCLCAWLLMLQANGLVPIVEPEVLMDGVHSIERSAEVRAVCVLRTLCLRSHPPNTVLLWTGPRCTLGFYLNTVHLQRLID